MLQYLHVMMGAGISHLRFSVDSGWGQKEAFASEDALHSMPCEWNNWKETHTLLILITNNYLINYWNYYLVVLVLLWKSDAENYCYEMTNFTKQNEKKYDILGKDQNI